MTSSFDPSAFLDVTTTEAATRRTPLPGGADFTGTIQDIKMRSWTGKQDPTKSGYAADVLIKVDVTSNPPIHSQVGYDSVILTDGIMLDTTDSGSLDFAPGKNTKLRRYREALGMNTAGQAFSLRAIVGRLIKVKIKQEPYEGELYDKIDSVAKAA